VIHTITAGDRRSALACKLRGLRTQPLQLEELPYSGRPVIDMSVYGTLHKSVASEVNVSDIGRRRSASAGAPDEARPFAAQPSVSFVRKAAPANEPFPATFRWIAGLPTEVRPLAALKQFPRIANMLAQAWHDSAAFREYMFDLLIDRRGGRQGFPEEVRSELLKLRAYFDHIHPHVPTVERRGPE